MVSWHNTIAEALPEAPAEAANDEGAAFELFLREQSSQLLAFLRRRSRSEEDAQDAVQESLARFVRSYRHLPPPEWKTVLYRIAINVANDRLRQARSRSLDLHVPIEGLEIGDEQPDAEEAAVLAQENALLNEAVLALPRRCRQAYLLRHARGMSNAEVAAHCGISVRMVEKHLANALVHIYRRFGRSPPDAL